MDASLREISENVQRVVESTRRRDTVLEFQIVYPENSGHYRRKNLGTVKVGTKGPDDLKTLYQLRFVIGDYMCLAINESKRGGQDTNDSSYGDKKSRENRREGAPRRDERKERT
jgi:hypothetical protein